MTDNQSKLQFKDQKILVTGGAGFLGKQVIAQLIAAGASKDLITVPRSKDDDLRSLAVCEKGVQLKVKVQLNKKWKKD